MRLLVANNRVFVSQLIVAVKNHLLVVTIVVVDIVVAGVFFLLGVLLFTMLIFELI